MTLTINLITIAEAEIVEVSDTTAAALAMLARGLSPIGTPMGGQVVRTSTRIPAGTFRIR